MSGGKKKARRGRGEGGVTKLPSGSYRVALSLGVGRDGKRIRDSVTAPTKSEALALARERLAEAGAGGGASAERGLTVGQWVARWMAQCQAHLIGSPLRSRRSIIRRNVEGRKLASVPAAKATQGDVRDWLAELEAEGRPPATRAGALKCVKAALSEAVRRGALRHSPADKVRGPRLPDREKRAMTRDQARALLAAAAGTPLAPYVTLALDSGCRPGELLALRRSDLLPDGRTLDVRRTRELETGVDKPLKTKGSRRRVLLSAPSAAALAALPPGGPDDRLIPRPGGRHDYFVWLFRPLKAAAKAAGVPWATPYTLRHTMATLLLAAGVNITAVAARLGHSSPAITLKHYAHALPGDQERAAEAMGELLGGVGTRPAHATDGRKRK